MRNILHFLEANETNKSSELNGSNTEKLELSIEETK